MINNPERNAIVYITDNQNAPGNCVIASFDLNNNLYGETAHKCTSIHRRSSESLAYLLEGLPKEATIFVKNENRLNSLLPGNQILKSLELLAKIESVGDNVSQKVSAVKDSYSIDEDLTENLYMVYNGDFDSARNEVHVGTASNFITETMGARQLDKYMSAEKAYRAIVTKEKAIFDGRYKGDGAHYHGLGVPKLVRVLEASETPVAAFADTPTKDNKRENRIVLVTDVKHDGGYCCVIEEFDTTARRDGQRIEAHKDITVYPNKNIASLVVEAAATGRILYMDKKRSPKLLPGGKGDNSLTAITEEGFANNICDFMANVNWKNSGNTEYTAESTTEELPEWN